MTDEQITQIRLSIVELGESIKELVRVIFTEHSITPGSPIHGRLQAIYDKATKAKDRVDILET